MQYQVDAFQQPSSKYTLNTYVHLEEKEEEEEDFQTVSLDDEHGIWKKSLIDIYVSMNIHYHMDYVHIHVHIQITKPSSYYDTLDLSDISDLKIWWLHPANEDIPALNDIGLLNGLWLAMNIYIYMNFKQIISIYP